MLPLKDSYTIPKFPIWIIGLILFNLLVFYLQVTTPDPEAFVFQYALIPNNINIMELSSFIPFISSLFLHGGIIHILSNMLFLWVFGRNIEAVLGFVLFPVFYILSGIVAGLAQYFITPLDNIPMLGASGAVAGILGAYYALFPFHKIKSLVFIFIFITVLEIPAYLLLFYWFITQLFIGITSLPLTPNTGGIAFIPHIAGFLFGWFTTMILFPKKSYHYSKKFI